MYVAGGNSKKFAKYLFPILFLDANAIIFYLEQYTFFVVLGANVYVRCGVTILQAIVYEVVEDICEMVFVCQNDGFVSV